MALIQRAKANSVRSRDEPKARRRFSLLPEPNFGLHAYAAMQQNLPTPLVLQAIALRKSLDAIYNGGEVKLAPHVLFSRHEELYLSAVTISREGRPPRESKLGMFKLAGLKGLSLADDGFDPFPGFDPTTFEHGGTALFALELEPDERLAAHAAA